RRHHRVALRGDGRDVRAEDVRRDLRCRAVGGARDARARLVEARQWLTAAQSMLPGSVALLVCSAACVATTRRRELPVWAGAVLAWGAWGAVAFGLWSVAHAVGGVQ